MPNNICQPAFAALAASAAKGKREYQSLIFMQEFFLFFLDWQK
jgi:hypothetical protein